MWMGAAAARRGKTPVQQRANRRADNYYLRHLYSVRNHSITWIGENRFDVTFVRFVSGQSFTYDELLFFIGTNALRIPEYQLPVNYLLRL
jgi:hypothetical protein